MAYNARFDAYHVRAWFDKNGDKFFGSWFFHPPIDVMRLAAVHVMRKRAGMSDFRLPIVGPSSVSAHSGREQAARAIARVRRNRGVVGQTCKDWFSGYGVLFPGHLDY